MAGNEEIAKSSDAGGQPSGAPAPVFVSYASQDATVANAVVESLERHGVKCWIAPRDVTPGSQYADEIVAAINDAPLFVLVLSEHAVESPHVGREVERAASKRRRIVVLRTDAAPLTRSFEYFLSESQWIDVAALGMSGALTKLSQAVGQRLAPSSWVSPGLGTDVRDPADRKRKPSYLTIKRGVAAVVFLAAAALVIGVMARYWPSKQEGPRAPMAAAITEKSIAVLPFLDLSEKKDQEFFGDGMAEEILDLLVKIPGLKVIGRTSSFQFKGKNADLRTIGTELGAAFILEGSVRKSGDRFRVSAQLIDSRNGTHLMSQTYDRDMSDILKMQDEIAATLVRALQIEVNTTDGIAPRPALRNAEAYTLYLQGRHAHDRFDQKGFEQAVNYFQRALEADPSFAAAAAELALTYSALGEWGFMPPAAATEKARTLAERAIRLEPNLAIAHAVLGNVHDVYDWDWAAADREINLALKLAPNDAIILVSAARQSLITGRWDDALRLLNASLEQDPLSPGGYIHLNWIQIRRGRLAEAEAAVRRTLDISPTFSYGHYYLGITLLARGQGEAALAEFQKESADGARLGGSAMAYFALGRQSESNAALADRVKVQPDEDAFGIALAYAFRGESDEAMRWLDRAYAQKDLGLYTVKGEPPLKSMEGDPRFKAFLKKMNLPE